jgi:hypothetical protein
MTVVLPSLTDPDRDVEAVAADQAQLLFQEAKQRRKRRWLVSGVVATVVALLIGLILLATGGRGGGGAVRPVAHPVVAGAAVSATSGFSLRPVLCLAPPFTPGAGQQAVAGPLPTCSAPSMLTAANLQVTPVSGPGQGYLTQGGIHPDPRFAGYASTSPRNDQVGSTVLLPAASATGTMRFVLGPAGLTASGIKSAHVIHDNGLWVVDLRLTPAGSSQWDALAHQQFHAMVGTDVGGRVVSTPIVEPTTSSFTSLDGHLQISGTFTRAQAEALADRL